MRTASSNLLDRLRSAFLTHKTAFFCPGLIMLLVTLFCFELFAPGLPVGTDLLLLTRDLSFTRMHSLWFSLWLPLDSFGFPISFGTQFNYILLAFSMIPDSVLATKLFIYVTFVLAGFSMYLFAQNHFENDIASFLAALVYIFNPIFILEAYAGHHTMVFGYAVAPLIFLTYDRALKTGQTQNIILSAILITTLFIAGHPQTTYVFGLFLTLFTFLEVIKQKNEERRAEASSRIVKASLLTIGLSILLSSYEILPMMFNAMSSNVLFSLGYTIEDTYVYSGQVYYAYLVALPLVALLTVLLRRDRYAFFFSLSALISIVVSMGPYPPFGGIFTWAFSNVPLFNMFRVPYRFSLMTALSASFLTGFLFANEYSKSKRNGFCSLLDKIKRVFSAWKTSKTMIATSAFVAIIVVSGLYVGYGAFGFPFGVYSFPPSYAEAYDWMAQQPGDYRILTVPYPAHYVDTSLMSGINRGWIWDPPVYSQALHGKVVITGYGGLVDTQDFLNFLGTQMSDNRTDDMMRLLGTLNTKYVVIHPYPNRDDPELSEPMRAFFNFQKGLTSVYSLGNITIMENEYCTPHLFAAEKYGIIVGGRDVLMSLMEIDSFNLSRWVLPFANQLSYNLFDELLQDANMLVLSRDGLRDLVMMYIDTGVRLRAVDYAFPSSNPWMYWIPSKWWTNQGKLVINGVSLRTNGSRTLDIPFDVESTGEYTLSIRIAFAPTTGNLTLFLDGFRTVSFKPEANSYRGFAWKDIESVNLEEGRHVLRLENDAHGLIDVDEIAIVPTTELRSQTEKIIRAIADSSAEVIYILEAETDLECRDFVDFQVERDYEASNGCALTYNPNKTTSQLRTSVLIPKSGQYMFAARVSSLRSGNMSIGIDNMSSEFIIPLNGSATDWQWVSVGPTNLTWGTHQVSIESAQEYKLDELILYTVDGRPTAIDQALAQECHTQMSYEQVNPSQYNIQVQSSAPFFIVFSESYHPLWKAYVDGKEIQAIPAYSFVNAFYVPEGGTYTINVQFTGQTCVVAGGIISSVTIICLATFVALKRKFKNTKVNYETNRCRFA